MKIFLFSRGYPSEKDSQWGCFERDQAMALKTMGYEVVVMCIDGRFKFFKRKSGISHISDHGIEVYNIYLFPLVLLNLIGHRLRLFVRQKIALYLFEKIIKKQGLPDIIYAHYLNNIYSASAIKKKYAVKLVGIEHWSILNRDKLPSYVKKMGIVGYSTVDQLISVSESLRQRILLHFNKDSIVVHNMVDENFFQMPIREYVDRDKLIYISIGSLIYRKGYDILIKALSEVARHSSNWELKIVGGGPEEKNLQNLIMQLGLKNNIKLVGRKNKQEIISLLHDSDVFIFSSRAENFSVAVLEALSAGLPVVATSCGGIRECINEKNGILVDVEDISSLASSIIKISKNLKSYNRQAIAKECERSFSPSIIIKEIKNIFESVINNR